MKNTIFKISVVCALVLSTASCKKEFAEVNTNPNQPSNVNPAYVLTNGIYQSAFRYYDVEANMDGGLIISQQWAKIQYTDEDRYRFRTTSYTNTWNQFYSVGIKDFTYLKELTVKDGGNDAYNAVGSVMRCWLFQILTDTYGDIPYTEAIGTILTPKYDKQEVVYKGLLAELADASAKLSASSSTISGDVLYGGDLKKWRKFANTLRAKIALRMADRDAVSAKAVFTAIGTDVISSQADAAEFAFLSAPNQNPIALNRITRDDHRISKTMVDKLKLLSDPRLTVYANLPEDSSNYVGAANGLTTAAAAAQGFTKTSKVGDFFTKQTAPAVIISYAETKFIMAEAAARNFTAASASQLYNEAITASMDYYGFTGAAVATYLAQPSVAYDAGNFKKSIGEQKWIALYGQGLEAWTEVRRLNFPVITPGPNASALSTGIPVRFRYSTDEQSLNKVNYDAAVASQGADLLTTKLWFDVN
jgi:Starch-binding associating with outer membrane